MTLLGTSTMALKSSAKSGLNLQRSSKFLLVSCGFRRRNSLRHASLASSRSGPTLLGILCFDGVKRACRGVASKQAWKGAAASYRKVGQLVTLDAQVLESMLNPFQSLIFLHLSVSEFPLKSTLTNHLADLKANMSVDTDEAIQNIHRTLQFAHEGTVFELGKSFYRNHVEFVAVAKEAERFESDLTAMRAIVSQLKTFGVQITGERQATSTNYQRYETNFSQSLAEATQPPSAKPATISLLVTNSPVVPEAPQVDVKEEVRAKLKKIAEVLPEASEFVASTTDILLESNELAVYIDKQWKPAQVWALSNGCLISSRKAKVSINSGVKQKMSFERFIPFDKCSISDVKDTPDLQNCFKLKGLAGSVFLHTPDSITKISWYSTIEARLNDLQSVKEQRPRKKTKHHFTMLIFVEINLAETVGKQVKAVIHRRTGSISTSGAASKPSLEGTFLDQQPELTPERIFVLQANLNDLADLIYRTQYDIAVDQLDRRKWI